MKILIVHDFGFLYGGGEVYITTIKRELEKRGNQVYIFTSDFGDKKKFSDFQAHSKSNKKVIGKFFKIFNLGAKQDIKNILNSFQPDIVHVHSVFYHLSPYVLTALEGYPVVMTVHNYFMFCATGLKYYPDGTACKKPFGRHCYEKGCVSLKEYKYQQLYRYFMKKFLNNVTTFIPCSSYGESLLRQNGFDNVILLHHGIDTNYFKAKKLPSTLSILYVGRLVKEKGVDYLLKAFSLLVKDYSRLKLIIAGDGPEEKELIELSKKLKLERNVVFLGKITNNKIKELYYKSNLVVVPSIWPENSPIVIYEAMSCGRPVIGSYIGGIPDLVKDGYNGFLTEARDEKSLYRKIKYLLSNKKTMEKLANNSRKIAVKNFTLDTHITNLLKIYNDVIHKKKIITLL